MSEQNLGNIKHCPAMFSHAIEKQLSAYASAAAAAGVSVIALVTTTQGKIIYTPANIGIGDDIPVQLDVNNDGVADFSFLIETSIGAAKGEPGSAFGVSGVIPSNAIWGQGNFASALESKRTVGPNKSYFQNGSGRLMGAGTFLRDGSSSVESTRGQWQYTKDRYLGLKFLVNGQTHYGWARLTVPGLVGNGATITGYAYETVPNKPIVTGKTKGPDVLVFEPASLGRLAQGASGISAWRK